MVRHRDRGDPSTSCKWQGHTEYEAATLESGVTGDVDFEQWANQGLELRQQPRAGDVAQAPLSRLGPLLLIAGSSGTGENMAADVLTNDLELNPYRIDLSSVVNKCIGETEENLCGLDAAKEGDAILLFDEADTLLASARRLRTAMTATRTSRPSICCSGSRPIVDWRC